jgi:hypothetical protein
VCFVTPTAYIGDQTPPAQRRRIVWAQKLEEQMRFVGWVTDTGKVDHKRLHRAVVEAGGRATRQAVEQWLAGKTSPTPENQAVIAKVLRTAPHFIFPVEAA